MNIGIVTTWFERGAAYVSRQYRDVLESKHSVFIYARGGEHRATTDPNWNDSRVTWSKPSVLPLESAIDITDFKQWIRSNRIEAILFNEQRWWDAVTCCDAMGVLTAAYVDYYTKATIPLFGCYDALICNTRRHFSVFEWHPQAHYIPWGTDLDVFRPQSLDPVHPGCVTFFHSAGMNPVRKGTDFVLDAFERLQDTSARLVIHTQAGFEGIESRVPLVEKLVAQDRLEVHAVTVGAPGLYHLGDVYVYPSRLDGIGLTVAEAQACGLPSIVPDEAPMNEFVTHESGAVARVASHAVREDDYYWPMCFVDVDDLSSRMRHYTELTPPALAAAKHSTYAHACKALSWKDNSRPLPGLFESIRPLSSEKKQPALRLAREFERRRARASVRHWASYYFPVAVRGARDLYRFSMGRRAKEQRER